MSRRLRQLILLTLTLFILLSMVPALRNAVHHARYPGMFVETKGQGDPVVMLHGLTGSHEYWRPVVAALQDRYRVILPDLLGFGKSAWPASGYTLEDHFQSLQLVMPQEPMHLIGFSLGSLIALEFAARHPERVKRLILLAPPSVDSREELQQILARQSKLESIMSLDSVWAPMVCHLHEILGGLTYYLYRPIVEKHIPDDVVRAATQHRWESYNGNLENVILQYQAARRLQETGLMETLVMVGENDGYSKNEELARLPLPLRKYPGSHNFLWRSPERAAQDIRAYLLAD